MADVVEWRLRILDRVTFAVLLDQYLPSYEDFTFSYEMSSEGNATVKLNLEEEDMQAFRVELAAELDIPLLQENFLQFVRVKWDDPGEGPLGEPAEEKIAFTMLMEDVDSDETTDETHTCTITGRGAIAVLEWTTILPDDGLEFIESVIGWENVPSITPLLHFKEQGDLRGASTLKVDFNFDDTGDSNAVAWPSGLDYEFRPGGDILKELKVIAEASGSVWMFDPDITSGIPLNIWQTYGPDKTAVAILTPGKNIRDHKIKRIRREIFNTLFTVSSTVFIDKIISSAEDIASQTFWERRELFVETARAGSPDTAEAFAELMLAVQKDEVLTHVIEIYEDEEMSYLFGTNGVNLGDIIEVEVSNFENSGGSYQIVGVSVKLDKEGNESITFTLGDPYQEALIRKLKQYERMSRSAPTRSELQSPTNIGAPGTGAGGSADLEVIAWTPTWRDGSATVTPGTVWVSYAYRIGRMVYWGYSASAGSVSGTPSGPQYLTPAPADMEDITSAGFNKCGEGVYSDYGGGSSYTELPIKVHWNSSDRLQLSYSGTVDGSFSTAVAAGDIVEIQGFYLIPEP